MIEFDLARLPEGFLDDPYPIYHALREAEPVKRMADGSLFLTRHADLAAVYRDAARFGSDKRREFAPKFGAGTPLFRHHTTSLVFNDAPAHTRVRRMLMGALTARAVAEMEPGVIRLVDTLLDEAEARGRIDAIADFAAAIPVEVIGNLLDIPHGGRGPLRRWSLAILGALEPAPGPAQLDEGHRAVEEFCAYLAALVAERRRHPGDPARDVLTRLIQGEGFETLSEEELLHNCIFILNAGHETTTNLIGNALDLLIRFPAARAALLAEPELMRPALEEFLRYESSNQLGNRITLREAEIGGVRVPAGTPVTLCIGAANRDPAAFAAPEVFDVRRWPNRHLAFGLGVHQCAGISVARLEAMIAIARFLARFPGFRPAGPAERGRRARFRGFVRLPLDLA